jgi:hypothetical protein
VSAYLPLAAHSTKFDRVIRALEELRQPLHLRLPEQVLQLLAIQHHTQISGFVQIQTAPVHFVDLLDQRSAALHTQDRVSQQHWLRTVITAPVKGEGEVL